MARHVAVAHSPSLSPRAPSGGVTLKRRCTYLPSVIYLIVNKLLSLSLINFSLSLSLFPPPCLPFSCKDCKRRNVSCTSARGSCGRHRRSPLRPRSTHTPAMPSVRLAAGPACIRRVSPRAHTIPHTTARTDTCSGAQTHTHMNTHRHTDTQKNMRAHTHMYTNVCVHV